MPSQRRDKVFRFGDFELDLRHAHLRRGDEEIELRPQSFEVLRLLVANAGRLISKQELHDAVWGEVAVTEDSLAHCISDIRKALGDADRSMVRTVPRRGYVFAGNVEVAAGGDTAAPPKGRSRAAIVAGAIVLAISVALWGVARFVGSPQEPIVVPPNSVAVLPFLDDPQSRGSSRRPQLGTTFSDQLRDQLGRVPGLRLAARASSVVVADEGIDVRAMAERLRVAYIVEGSYSEDRNDVRVSVRLIDGSSGLSLWSDTLERRSAELLFVQQSIADEIVSRLLPDAAAPTATVATRNASANNLLLLARHKEQEVRNDPEVDVPKLLEAIDLYRQATALDPTSALAFSRLADALLYLGDVEGAEAPILRALALDPDISEVQDTLGKYYWASRQQGAGAAWERALELNPNNAEALASYGYWLWLRGETHEPEPYFRRALELDRLSLERYWEIGNFLGTQGHVDGVRDLIEEVEQLFQDPPPYELLSRLHEFLGEIDHAVAWTLRARNAYPDDPAHDWRLSELLSIIGDYDAANALGEPGMGTLFFQRRYGELVDMGEDLIFDEPDDVMVRYLLAFGYNALESYELALSTLESTQLLKVISYWPPAESIEAWATYLNALDGLGDTRSLEQLAREFLDRPHVANSDWWVNTYEACVFELAGERNRALQRLERVTGSARIPWYPVIYDSRCFEPLQGTRQYTDVTEWIEEKRAEQRDRLPATLLDYGVTL
ncbi:MAG: winged helix-turn-helix domain-containing protein [Woeseiaceae bacterium]|nr:winged helix-turn-helix domain-containing protein [Woeseiaceae bacterium]